MSRVLFVQHGEHDSPGLFATVLAEAGIELEIVHPWCEQPLPGDLERFDGLALGGGGMSAYETAQYPYLLAEMDLVRRARRAEKPVLGMCLGAQLMAAALGGEVFPNRAKEIGFYEVRFTEAARSDAVWEECCRPFQPVHWHGDTFSLPPDATLLAGSQLTPHQLFRVDECLYGMQFHLEMNLAVLSAMVAEDDAYLSSLGIDPAILLRTAALAFPAVEPIAHTVFTRWANLLQPALAASAGG